MSSWKCAVYTVLYVSYSKCAICAYTSKYALFRLMCTVDIVFRECTYLYPMVDFYIHILAYLIAINFQTLKK